MKVLFVRFWLGHMMVFVTYFASELGKPDLSHLRVLLWLRTVELLFFAGIRPNLNRPDRGDKPLKSEGSDQPIPIRSGKT